MLSLLEPSASLPSSVSFVPPCFKVMNRQVFPEQKNECSWPCPPARLNKKNCATVHERKNQPIKALANLRNSSLTRRDTCEAGLVSFLCFPAPFSQGHADSNQPTKRESVQERDEKGWREEPGKCLCPPLLGRAFIAVSLIDEERSKPTVAFCSTFLRDFRIWHHQQSDERFCWFLSAIKKPVRVTFKSSKFSARSQKKKKTVGRTLLPSWSLETVFRSPSHSEKKLIEHRLNESSTYYHIYIIMIMNFEFFFPSRQASQAFFLHVLCLVLISAKTRSFLLPWKLISYHCWRCVVLHCRSEANSRKKPPESRSHVVGVSSTSFPLSL